MKVRGGVSGVREFVKLCPHTLEFLPLKLTEYKLKPCFVGSNSSDFWFLRGLQFYIQSFTTNITRIEYCKVICYY